MVNKKFYRLVMNSKLNYIVTILFLEHPQKNNMTYCQHMKRAWYMAYKMLLAFMGLFIHGLVPCVFETTGTDTIKDLSDYISVTHDNTNEQKKD
jgi:hypothetical protein